ncbi:hypothetical protein LSAT2_026484 [Lamellibrachia satsuma]|nr:hypothetical protein LSAT2_026484 [Lamellibrachia satsuma]
MKSFTILLVFVTVTVVPGSGGTVLTTMADCLLRSKHDWRILFAKGATCAFSEMFDQYLLMRYGNCTNCDKYFHCQANYNAVRLCSGGYERETAIVISECREISQLGTDSPDGAADMRAKEYGRNGGNCYAEYGCANNCNYKASNGSCISSNC